MADLDEELDQLAATVNSKDQSSKDNSADGKVKAEQQPTNTQDTQHGGKVDAKAPETISVKAPETVSVKVEDQADTSESTETSKTSEKNNQNNQSETHQDEPVPSFDHLPQAVAKLHRRQFKKDLHKKRILAAQAENALIQERKQKDKQPKVIFLHGDLIDRDLRRRLHLHVVDSEPAYVEDHFISFGYRLPGTGGMTSLAYAKGRKALGICVPATPQAIKKLDLHFRCLVGHPSSWTVSRTKRTEVNVVIHEQQTSAWSYEPIDLRPSPQAPGLDTLEHMYHGLYEEGYDEADIDDYFAEILFMLRKQGHSGLVHEAIAMMEAGPIGLRNRYLWMIYDHMLDPDRLQQDLGLKGKPKAIVCEGFRLAFTPKIALLPTRIAQDRVLAGIVNLDGRQLKQVEEYYAKSHPPYSPHKHTMRIQGNVEEVIVMRPSLYEGYHHPSAKDMRNWMHGIATLHKDTAVQDAIHDAYLALSHHGWKYTDRLAALFTDANVQYNGIPALKTVKELELHNPEKIIKHLEQQANKHPYEGTKKPKDAASHVRWNHVMKNTAVDEHPITKKVSKHLKIKQRH